MEGLKRSIERGVVVTDGNGSWKNAALHVLWALIVAIMGWFLTESGTEREHARTDNQRLQQERVVDNARISVLEEQFRNLRESLQRIETGVDELRKDRRR